MLANQVSVRDPKCTCRNTDKPWCPGSRYVFLGPEHGHFRRSNYSERFFRPAADGSYPARGQRSAMPVLVDTGAAYPGRPVPPWRMAVLGQNFSRRSAGAWSAWSATPRPAGARFAGARGRGDWTATKT
jgi:hypothetical protein